MYTIGICDDIPELCDMLQNQIEQGNFTEEPCEMHIFHSAREIIDAKPKLDILFLDIEMPEMSGMELMRQYGYLLEDTKVVFLTSHSHYVYEAFEVKVFRFLRKPADEYDLRKIFDDVKKESVIYNTITLPIANGEDISVRLKDIFYIESRRNYSYIFTTKDTLKCKLPLKDILPKLPETFFYSPHRAFIVNMMYVLRIFQKERRIRMANNDYVDISYRKVTECVDFYMKFSRR